MKRDIQAPDKWFQDKIKKHGGIFDKDSYVRSVRIAGQGSAIDIGAHCGSWTVPMCERFKEVHAFEPDGNNFKYLKKNTQDIDNLTIYNDPLGYKRESVSMQGGDNSGQAHVASGSDLKIKRLDDYGFKDVAYIKIDTEGYELNVLRGAENTIKENMPVICLELNGLSSRYGLHDSKVVSWLYSRGYILRDIVNKDYIFSDFFDIINVR